MTKLKAWLKENRYKQVEFAAMIGCSTSHLSNFVRGRHIPSDDIKARISDVTKGEVPTSAWAKKNPDKSRG